MQWVHHEGGRYWVIDHPPEPGAVQGVARGRSLTTGWYLDPRRYRIKDRLEVWELLPAPTVQWTARCCRTRRSACHASVLSKTTLVSASAPCSNFASKNACPRPSSIPKHVQPPSSRGTTFQAVISTEAQRSGETRVWRANGIPRTSEPQVRT